MKFRTDKDFGFMHAEDAKELKNAVEIIDKALYVNDMLSAPVDGVDYYKVALLAKDEDYLKAVEILNDFCKQFLSKKKEKHIFFKMIIDKYFISLSRWTGMIKW